MSETLSHSEEESPKNTLKEASIPEELNDIEESESNEELLFIEAKIRDLANLYDIENNILNDTVKTSIGIWGSRENMTTIVKDYHRELEDNVNSIKNELDFYKKKMQDQLVEHAEAREESVEKTEISSIRQLSDEEIENFNKQALSLGRSEISELISQDKFIPYKGIEFDGNEYYFSPITIGGSRNFVVAYQKSSDHTSHRISKRLFYKSNSDGGWRSTPGIYEGEGILSKGGHFYDRQDLRREDYGQYAAATRASQEIADTLDDMEVYDSHSYTTFDELSDLFTIKTEPSEFSDQVNLTVVRGYGMDGYVAGSCFRKHGVIKGRELLENMSLPKGFEPNFSEDPINVYQSNHSLLGDTKVEVFDATLQGQDIEWHIASDQEDRIWIDRIEFKDGKSTTYGTEGEVILAGALSMKPLEYIKQLNSYSEELSATLDADYTEYNHKYGDIQPTIRRMPWAKKYLQNRKGVTSI